MGTHVEVPCQQSACYLWTICSHWELGHFSWLALLFEGFSISGLSSVIPGNFLGDLCLHQMNSPDWSCGSSYRYHGWWKPEWEVQTHLVSFSALFCAFLWGYRVGFSQLCSHQCRYQSYFRLAALQGCPTLSLGNFGFFLKCCRGICTILKTSQVFIFFL